jgi:hypothetical protein
MKIITYAHTTQTHMHDFIFVYFLPIFRMREENVTSGL